MSHYLQASKLNVVHFLLSNSPAGRYEDSSYLPAYEDGTECSETLTHKTQAPANYPEENTQHSEHGESLKSSKLKTDPVWELEVSFTL
jgi:hypothetical protein